VVDLQRERYERLAIPFDESSDGDVRCEVVAGILEGSVNPVNEGSTRSQTAGSPASSSVIRNSGCQLTTVGGAARDAAATPYDTMYYS